MVNKNFKIKKILRSIAIPSTFGKNLANFRPLTTEFMMCILYPTKLTLSKTYISFHRNCWALKYELHNNCQ